MDIDFTLDGGAYMTLSPVVLSRGTIHAAGPYACPNVRIRSRAVATNFPPHGAFRGFGAPQSVFALERHLDQVAKAVGLAPDELRRRNFVREGQTLAVGQIVHEKIDMNELMERAFELSGYRAKRERFARENPGSAIKRGIGFASFLHGAGFTGSGEDYLASVADVEATSDGKIRVCAASTEMGQGTNTIFSQIAADALGLDFASVEIVQPDTAQVPNSGPTVASRTCMIVGKLVESAALGREAIALTEWTFARGQWTWRFRRRVPPVHRKIRHPSRVEPLYRRRRKFIGTMHIIAATLTALTRWAVYVAEVSVDTLTGETRVDRFCCRAGSRPRD